MAFVCFCYINVQCTFRLRTTDFVYLIKIKTRNKMALMPNNETSSGIDRFAYEEGTEKIRTVVNW